MPSRPARRAKRIDCCVCNYFATLLRMELGHYTFADLHPGVTPEQRMRDLLEEVELADQVGLDVFGVGEHHRPDYAVSAPAVVLARGRADHAASA